jgi:dolichyl-phosphate beta-glucosyltransferase
VTPADVQRPPAPPGATATPAVTFTWPPAVAARGTATAAAMAAAPAPRAPVDLDLVIPVLNEEHRLPATLAELAPFLRRWRWRCRVVVVDNGSVDGTADVVDRAGAVGAGVDLLGCRTRGKGAAVRTGVAHSRARWVGYLDADRSTPLAALDDMVHQLRRGADVVVGSRRCPGARLVAPAPLARRVASRVFHAATATLVGPVGDSQCGIKLFDGETARALFAETSLAGFTFDVELLARARQRGLKVVEVPVDWSHCGGSTLQIGREGVKVVREIVAVHRAVGRPPVAGPGRGGPRGPVGGRALRRP